MNTRISPLLTAILIAGSASAAFAADSGVKSQSPSVYESGRTNPARHAKADGRVVTGTTDIHTLGRAGTPVMLKSKGVTLMTRGNKVNVNDVSRG